MLLSLQSTGPQYNHIQTNIQIPWNCEYIKYYVESVNMKSLLITTNEDFIILQYGVEVEKPPNEEEEEEEENPNKKVYKIYDVNINFTNSYTIENKSIKDALEYKDEKIGPILKVEYDRTDRVIITPIAPFIRFRTITHRAGLVTGLYNIKLDKEYYTDEKIIGDIPIRDYANKLYLVSKQGQSIKSNIGDREYNPSIIANIDHLVRAGLPIIANFEFLGKPIKNIVNIDSFKQIELELVDFQYQPVPLMSPMFVTIKVKPCDSPRMRL